MAKGNNNKTKTAPVAEQEAKTEENVSVEVEETVETKEEKPVKAEVKKAEPKAEPIKKEEKRDENMAVKKEAKAAPIIIKAAEPKKNALKKLVVKKETKLRNSASLKANVVGVAPAGSSYPIIAKINAGIGIFYQVNGGRFIYGDSCVFEA